MSMSKLPAQVETILQDCYIDGLSFAEAYIRSDRVNYYLTYEEYDDAMLECDRKAYAGWPTSPISNLQPQLDGMLPA